jgi:hypothetical protein
MKSVVFYSSKANIINVFSLFREQNNLKKTILFVSVDSLIKERKDALL